MTIAAKVAFVASVQARFGLSPALSVAGLSRSTWYYHQKEKVAYEAKYAHLRPLLEEIAREHTAYGYRRTTSELQDTFGQPVNHKVVQRLHRLWGLPLLRTTHRPQPSGIRQVIVAAGTRVNLVAQLNEITPLMVLYTDFTELRYADGNQKAMLMPIIDHGSKVILGWALGESANRTLALKAWDVARQKLEQLGVDPAHIIMHHDQDAVYTSYAWTGRLLLEDHLHISYTLDGAKDNPEMEAFNSRFKNENRSLLLDAPTLEVLKQVVKERLNYYNEVRRHSSLGNVAPLVYLHRWQDQAGEKESMA